jgi:hypothetical protein
MLFSLSFQDIRIGDVQELLANGGYPESEQVEYKEYVPGRDGPDQWHADPNRGISEYARDKLLAEIVAFANTHGGHFIVGIQESADRPKRAVAIRAVNACADLADRLRQAAFANIEPRLAALQVKSVPTDEQGNGVLVVRVPQSRGAPHRLMSTRSDTARHCYIRRGDSTEALTMREIQDLTLNIVRGHEAVLRGFDRLRADFDKHLSKAYLRSDTHATIGIRASAVPIQALSLNRHDIEFVRDRIKRDFLITYRPGYNSQALLSVYGYNTRPTLRGLSIYNEFPDAYYEHVVLLDGSHNLIWMHQAQHNAEADNVAYLSWILGASASLLHALSRTSEVAEHPAAEFGVEIEIRGFKRGADVVFDNHGRGRLPETSFILPQYSFIPEAGESEVLNQVYVDVLNTLGLESRLAIVAVTAP